MNKTKGLRSKHSESLNSIQSVVQRIMSETQNLNRLPVLGLIQDLCKMMEFEGITYCHWKSNNALDRSASGVNDLDLLVSRADANQFTEILNKLGFKQVEAPAEEQMPGVLDYYGYDNEVDKLIHVHAHYQLILGHDMTKNFRLPIEKPYLESAIQGDLFKVPTPEFEFIVFVIRMVLKHSTWDAILGRQGTLKTAEREELAYLQARINLNRVYDILKQHLLYINGELFDRCLQTLQPACSIWTRIKTGQQLQTRLLAHARRPLLIDTCLKLWRRGIWAIRRYIFKHSPQKRVVNGGAIIALVGGDGAGKSTAVEELYSWLSKDFATIKVHMGRPPRSWTSFICKGTLKVGRLIGSILNRKATVQSGAVANPIVFSGYSIMLWHILTARDRYRAYAKARRFATNGGFVICDRYPIPKIKLMDGAHIRQIKSSGKTNRIIEFLTHVEERYYKPIVLPELLIMLRVDPEIAVQRKTDEEPASVLVRNQEIWDIDWQQTPAHVIDACQPRVEVLSELKSLIWSEL